jgi:hypothetical protein
VLPALLRIFVASDQIAVVEATKPGEAEEQAAETATQYITQIFYRDNDGFSILHDAFKDGLLSKIGWVKRWWQVKTRQEAWSGSGLTPQEYQAKIAELAKGGSVEVLEQAVCRSGRRPAARLRSDDHLRAGSSRKRPPEESCSR